VSVALDWAVFTAPLPPDRIDQMVLPPRRDGRIGVWTAGKTGE